MKLASLLLAVAVGSGSARAAPQPEFQQAVQEFHLGDWSGAYARFARLANDGNPEAARIALFMYREGALLYGSDWAADEDELARWTRLAASGPRPAEFAFERTQRPRAQAQSMAPPPARWRRWLAALH